MIQNFNEFTISNEENVVGGRRKRSLRKRRSRREQTGGFCIAMTEDVEVVVDTMETEATVPMTNTLEVLEAIEKPITDLQVIDINPDVF